MAVVKAKFVKRGKGEKNRAKASLRYIQHRPGKDGDKITRTLFGRDGAMERIDAYRMIDEAGKADILFKFIISPDPDREDQKQDLNMREITEQIMLKVEEVVNKSVIWTAAVHADHTGIRHVHALARVPGRLYPAHFNLLIHEATKVCLEQRRELDLIQKQRELEREAREEAQWGRGL
jgi:hypothetical protein